eukprot:jgi/Tetstr1/458653/TSEL_045046.t1
MLRDDAGVDKVNFAGGEPFLQHELLGDLVRFCKVELGMATSVISNASLIAEDWMERYGAYLDMLGVSVDSFNEDINRDIGRGSGAHLEGVFRARSLCSDHGIKFKLNTVVCALNWGEDMNEQISALSPDRWKVFQMLLLGGENAGGGDLRDAAPLEVTEAQFRAFIDRHAQQSCCVPEDNAAMRNSYLLLDEKMRFLNCSSGSKVAGDSILDVGVPQALKQAGFDAETFVSRGGVYKYRK